MDDKGRKLICLFKSTYHQTAKGIHVFSVKIHKSLEHAHITDKAVLTNEPYISHKKNTITLNYGQYFLKSNVSQIVKTNTKKQ